MNEKFELLKKRAAALRKGNEDGPKKEDDVNYEAILSGEKAKTKLTDNQTAIGVGGGGSQGWGKEGPSPRGTAPLSTTTGSLRESKFKESGREITSAGSPNQHSGKTPSAFFIQPESDREKDLTDKYGWGTKVDPKAIKQYTAHKHAKEAVDSYVSALDRADDPKFTGDPVDHIMNATSLATNFINDLPRLKSYAENVSGQEAHQAGAAKKMLDRRKEAQSAWVGGAKMFKPGTFKDVPLDGQTHATRGMTPEQVAEQNPDLVRVAEDGQNPETEKFMRQFPKGSHNIISASHINRLREQSGPHAGSFMNMMNTPEQMKNSDIIANLARRPVDKMRALPLDRTPVKETGVAQETKTETKEAALSNNFKLHFPEHAPPPSLNHEEFSKDQIQDPGFAEKADASNQEKDATLKALADAHSYLSDATLAHSMGKASDYEQHIQKASIAAKKAQAGKTTETKEYKNANNLLTQIPGLIASAQNFPHTATKKGEHTQRDVLRAIQNHLHHHAAELRHTGAAFKDSHVKRTPESEIVSPKNIGPESVQSGQDFQDERPLSPRQRTESARPVAIHEAADPDNEHRSMGGKLIKPRNNTIANEFADHFHRNTARAFTHGGQAQELFSQDALDSVPLTTLHNHFHPNDSTKLGGKPARQFVKDMTEKVLNNGFKHLPQDEKDKFIKLNRMYDNNDKMDSEDMSALSDLHRRIQEIGTNKTASLGHASQKELRHFTAARAAAANKQHREDYEGEDSALSIKEQADQVAANKDLHPAEANRQLRELFKRLPPSEKTQITFDGGSISHNPKAVMGNSRTRSAVRNHIENLRRGLSSSLMENIKKPQKPTEKSMPTPRERLNKAKDSLAKYKEKLNKAVVPTGKYVRHPDGTLILVDGQSNPAVKQQKDTALAQKPPTPPKPESKVPAQPPAPPPAPKNLGQQAQKLRTDAAMSAFNYTPKKG